MTLPDGFKVTQFAAEPHVVQPFAFCFDSRGRVWVCENLNYETRRSDTFKEGPKGRIIILEDTDGDGHFDKKKVFADKLFFPTGLQVGFGGVGSAHRLTSYSSQTETAMMYQTANRR